MSLAARVRGRVDYWKITLKCSFERGLGRDLWKNIMSNLGQFPPEHRKMLIEVRDHQMSMENDEAWFMYVGQVARNCPQLPKEQRVLWVISELHRRVPT